jgi:hypothetical protein
LKYFLFHCEVSHNLYIVIDPLLLTFRDWNVLPLAAYPQYHDIPPCMYGYSWISNVINPCLAHLRLAASCCTALIAQQWRRQDSGPTGCCSTCGQAVGYEHAFKALLTPLFPSEHSGNPSEAAGDAGPGARKQIAMAIRPDSRAADQIRYPTGYHHFVFLAAKIHFWPQPIFYPLFLNEGSKIRKNRPSKLHYRF